MTKLLVIMIACIGSISIAAQAAGKPHILIILADDLGWNDVGYHGSPIQTPNIDRIASEGIELDRFYVQPTCSPTRAGLMTGKLPQRFGIYRPLNKTTERSVPLEEQFLPEYLADQGYQSFMVGKWHLGHTSGLLPSARGFDRTIAMADTGADNWEQRTYLPIYDKANWYADGAEHTLPDDFYSSKFLVDKTIEFIDSGKDDGKPFFAYVPFTQTHEPVDAHPDFKGKTGNGSFADVLAQTDSYVGELLSTVEKLGLKDNTIFIFTSDNGREGIKRSFGFTGPWRGAMFSPYEGSLRVPFLIRYPDHIPAQQVSNDPVHLVDLFPTLAKFAGGKIPQDRTLDGLDQSKFFMAKTPKSPRESVIIYIGNELFGVKWRNWKMLLKEIDEDSYAIQTMAYPSIYNLLVDPKEEEPEKFYLDDTWVDYPLWEVIEAHELSIEKDAGAPGP